MAKLTKEAFVESLKEMSIKEVMELVEAMKEEFGVDPAAAVAVAAAPGEAAEAAKLTLKWFLKLITVKKFKLLKLLKIFLVEA